MRAIAIGRPWPAPSAVPIGSTDERFATGTGRAINARELIALLDAIFATRPLDEWAEAFDAEPELFWSRVNSIEDVIADEQFLAAKSVVDVPDEQAHAHVGHAG